MSADTDYLKQFIKTLDDPNVFSAVQFYYQSALDNGTVDDCVDLAELISDLLVKSTKLQKANPQTYDEYQKMWYGLIVKGFPALDASDQTSFLQQKVFFAVQKGLDIDQLIESEFHHVSNKDINDKFRGYAHALEQNSETLGANPITVQGKRFLPTLKYWLLDYANFPSQSAKRGAVERLNYVNQSQNTRALTQVQKQQLLKILKLYDNFLNPDKPLSDVEKAIDQEDFDIDTTEGSVQPSAVRAEVPVPTAPVPVAQPKRTVDIEKKLQELRNRKL